MNRRASITSILSPNYDPAFARLADSGVFTSFLPVKLKQQLIRNQTPSVRAELMEGAVLFVDVSGFTALSEKLKKVDEEGAAEELCVRLNKFFTKIISTVYRNGGDVIKFSGDAVTVVFLAGQQSGAQSSGIAFPDVKSAALQATKTSEALHDTVDERTATEDGLSLHMAIGTGQLTGVHVGGAHNRMEFILAGQPMDQISVAESMAAKDETCISPEAFDLVKEECEGTLVHELTHGYYQTAHVKSKTEEDKKVERLNRMQSHREDKARGYRMVTRDQFKEWREEQRTKEDIATDTGLSLLHMQRHNDISIENMAALYPVVETMKSFIPGAVVKRLADGQDVDQDGSHLAEMLKLSVIFVCIEGLDFVAKDKADLERVKNLGQRFMLKVQESVYSCEGSINKILVDDKGLLCVCALGLPPMYHGDDPTRAVQCAGNLLKNLQTLEEKPLAKIGVTTGRAFCGVVGSSLRREYTVMGTTVNLAARLMSNAEWGGIMVCENTKKEATTFDYSDAIVRNLKGIGPRRLYKPVYGKKKDKKKKKKGKKKDFGGILNELEWGREDEICHLYAIIRKLRDDKMGVMLLTGERGSGKTFLVDQFSTVANTVGLELLQSQGAKAKEASMPYRDFHMFSKLYQEIGVNNFEPAQKWTMYSAWHEIIEVAVQRGAEGKNVDKLTWVNAALASYDNGRLENQAYYLNTILPDLKLPEPRHDREAAIEDALMMEGMGGEYYPSSPMSRMLTGEKLIEKVGDLLCALLVEFAREREKPVLVVVHIQQQTSIVRANAENWGLLMSLGSKPNIIVAAVTRTIENTFDSKEGMHEKDVVQLLLEKTTLEKTKLDLQNFEGEFAKKFASDVLSNKAVQKTGNEVLPYKIAKPDLPDELVRVLSEVGFGNPKNIVEFLDVLMTGYENEEDWYSLINDKAMMDELKGQWHEPAMSIEDHHVVKINADLGTFPPPAKIVGYVLQAYEALPIHQQYLLKVGSIYDFGFSVEMLRPLILEERKAKLAKDLEDLVSQQFLTFVKRDDRTAFEWKPIQQLDPEANGIYLFHSRLLLKLIINRFVKKEREAIELRMQKVRVRSRWRRIRSFIEEIHHAKSRLESIGFEVMDQKTFFRFVNKADYMEEMRSRAGTSWTDVINLMRTSAEADQRTALDNEERIAAAAVPDTMEELQVKYAKLHDRWVASNLEIEMLTIRTAQTKTDVLQLTDERDAAVVAKQAQEDRINLELETEIALQRQLNEVQTKLINEEESHKTTKSQLRLARQKLDALQADPSRFMAETAASSQRADGPAVSPPPRLLEPPVKPAATAQPEAAALWKPVVAAIALAVAINVVQTQGPLWLTALFGGGSTAP